MAPGTRYAFRQYQRSLCGRRGGYVEELIKALDANERDFARIADKTAELVREIREMDTAVDTIDELLQQYSLDTHEGLMLMCLAEAMLRIPDKATADALIEDKLGPADWKSYLGQSESWMVNASTWGLLMTGRVVTMDKPHEGRPPASSTRWSTAWASQ